MYQDGCLDSSGWSPEALSRLLELSSRLSFEEASALGRRFGLLISGSSLELLTRPYAQHCEQAVRDCLSRDRQGSKRALTRLQQRTW
jgi:hypothetical protein